MSPLDQLNEKLIEQGIEAIKDVDHCPERTAYLGILLAQDWDNKEWVKEFKSKRAAYVLAFHNYFASIFPYLRYEIGEPKTYWQYDEAQGVYSEVGINSAVTFIVELLIREGLTENANETFAKTVLTRFRSMYRERGSSYDDFDALDDWFHANNGWVNLVSLEFEPHAPVKLSRRKSAVDYKAEAECSRYDQFLNEDLELKADQVRVINQFSGLCLTSDIKYEKMLTLLGRTGCGKSTLMNTWSYVLGDLAIEKKLTDLSSESARFAGSSFLGSTLCWFDEVDVKKAEMGNSLGTLITGKNINIERKGIDGIVKARNTVKCVLTANRLPLTAEIGIYRRLILIHIPVSFHERGTEDRQMDEKLRAEASGILNRMVAGLHDLRKMNGFTMIAGHDDLIEEYKAQSDTIAEFLDEYFEVGAEDDFVETRDLFESYRHFAEGNSWSRSITPQKFGRLLASQPLTRFAQIKPKLVYGRGRGWIGLRLKSEYRFDIDTGVIEEVKSKEF